MNIDTKRKTLAGTLVAPHKSGGKVGTIRVGRETQGRSGKGVTVVTGLPLSPSALDNLAKQFKRRCGSGGAVRNGNIEIQGDHRDFLVAELVRLGWAAKRSGG